MQSPSKEAGYQGYFFQSGPYYEPDVHEGHNVIGFWEKDTFQPPLIFPFGTTANDSVLTAHVAELDNGEYLVRKIGFRNMWRGYNFHEVVLDNLDDAIEVTNMLVTQHNISKYQQHIIIRVLQVSFVLVVALAYLLPIICPLSFFPCL